MGPISEEVTRELLAYCRRELESDLRVLTRYGRDVHEFVYTREDLQREFDEDSRGVFRYPLVHIHDAVWRMKQLHHLLEEPDAVTYSYGDTCFVQFPATEEEGILVTFDVEDEVPEDFLAECKAIVHGRE